MTPITQPTTPDPASLLASQVGRSDSSANAGGALTAQQSEDRFLTLLVAQMRNQDPLNPMDNAQVTTQMAQISTVSGVDRLNATLKAMAGGFSDSYALQTANLLGREVLVAGAELSLEAGSAHGGFSLAGAADEVTVVVKNTAGTELNRVDLGAQSAGMHSFTWDGNNDLGQAVPAGSYRFSVIARQGLNPVSAETLSAGRVAGVSRDATGPTLDINGLGTRRPNDIRQIL